MDLFIINIGQLVTVSANGHPFKAGKEMKEVGVQTNAAMLIRDGIIRAIGPADSIRPSDEIEVLDAGNRVALPGFVDSHTHTVFAGSREHEFAMRAAGATYQEIAARGGGILSTVAATRAASKKELLRSAERRLTSMMKHGTTTVEIKSGYGLQPETEMRMLEVIKELERDSLMTVVSTFLGAHAFPPEYRDDKTAYVDLIINHMLPHVGEKNLAMFCDVFCETGYFTVEQTEAILTAAHKNGLMLKVHADQLSAIGATELGVRMNAVSIDHLERITMRGIEALGQSSTIATILPGVSFFLNDPYAPARKLIDSGIPVAIASDFNPGSCMSYSIPMMMTLACTQMKMTPEEAISAATINGAAALKMSDRIGSIEIGKQADIVLFDVPNYEYIAYHYGDNHVWKVIKHGIILEL